MVVIPGKAKNPGHPAFLVVILSKAKDPLLPISMPLPFPFLFLIPIKNPHSRKARTTPAKLHNEFMQELRQQVLWANQEISRLGLAIHTFGNVSAIDRSTSEPKILIKPSGVPYATMTADDLVLTNLDGKILDGRLNPSSDLETHLVLYREFPQINSVVHTHSEFATAWAQAGQPIPCFGTTHADYFHGPIPVTDPLTAAEVESGYVQNTGHVIARLFREKNLDPTAVPGVLVAGHAPFAWGTTPAAAVEHADLLEFIARLAYRTVTLANPAAELAEYIAHHHYQRKHGPKATYGQK